MIQKNFVIILALSSAYFITALFIYGWTPLYPLNINWILESDLATYYIGWEYFRKTPLHWPLGTNPNYGSEFSGSIVLSTHNLIYLTIFNIMNPILPNQFQYFGIMIYINTILLGISSYTLILNITNDKLMSALASLFFAAAPIVVFRHTGHFDLGSHFIIILSFLIILKYESDKFVLASAVIWIISSLIHLYLLFITFLLLFPIALTIVVRGIVNRKINILYVTSIGFTFAALLLGLHATLGLGESGPQVARGFGHYKANLLTWFDPNGYSRVLPEIPNATDGEYEGGNYLGLGIILALLCVVVARVFLGSVDPKNHCVAKLTPEKKWALIGAVSVLVVTAITHNIGFGPYSWLIPVPDTVVHIGSIIRGSGRFLWPVTYLVMLLVLIQLWRIAGPKSYSIITVLLLVQLFDLSSAYCGISSSIAARNQINVAPPYAIDFKVLKAAGYDKIRTDTPGDHGENWIAFGYHGSRNGIAVDTTYLARPAKTPVAKIVAQRHDELINGLYDQSAAYVIQHLMPGLIKLRAGDAIYDLGGGKVLVAKANLQLNLPLLKPVPQ